VIWKRFARVLVRKSDRALASARLALAARDYDGAVNRAYYAMFDMARAALLSAGVAEDRLPRTYNGVIDVFRQHAVQSGRMDPGLAIELSRPESHRIQADYTDLEIELNTAAEVVAKAELFVQAVERTFGLDEHSLGTKYDSEKPKPGDKTSESTAAARIERKDAPLQALSLEQERRQARENWLRLRQQTNSGEGEINPERDAGRFLRHQALNCHLPANPRRSARLIGVPTHRGSRTSSGSDAESSGINNPSIARVGRSSHRATSTRITSH
jgi:uncharacterized protein (UPF0332 family)